MTRICFATYEIFPTTGGGCGALLHNAARMLLSQGHEVIFVLDLPHTDFDRFQYRDRLALPHSERCRTYHVEALCQNAELRRADFLSAGQWRACRFDLACRKVVEKERPEVIEFLDYCGGGYYALAAKAAGRAYGQTHLAVRLHNSVELIDSFEATRPLDLERYNVYALEHGALQMAETVLYPSRTYLDKAYKPRYEAWFGRQLLSNPPLVDIPRHSGTRADANVVLFYGRLFAFKGVDRFIDAAVALLNQGADDRLQFVLAGQDANLAPDGSARYQDYLRKKIPAQHQDRFVFPGHLDRRKLEELLPTVLYAVFPNYLEAFCYAAHELYAAGIPLIVSNIPNFEDYFQHERNALVFDGSAGDLARQMLRLSADADLRRRIARPFPIADEPLGPFYDQADRPSWLARGPAARQPTSLVCVIDDDRDRAQATLAALDRASLQQAHVALLRPAGEGEHAAGTTWLLGASYLLYDGAGQPIAAADLRTAETLLILRAGDIPSPTYVASCLDILARQAQLGFVGCWKRISDAGTTWLQTFPLDTALELAPFCEQSPLSRAVMRTPPGRLLIDLFDPQAGAYGELAYLWKLDSGRQRGLLIPEPLIIQLAETATAPSPSTLTYLIANDDSPWRKARLARFLLTVVGASHDAAAVPRLRQEHDMFERQIQSIYDSKVWKLIRLYRRIGSWRRSAQRHGRGLGQRALIRARRWWGRVRHSEV